MKKVVALDEPNDEQGYHGKTKWMREKVAGPITECSINEFIYTIKNKKDRLQQVIMTIRQIDKDHNGYVTRNELDDILKLYFEEFITKDLDNIVNQFSSLQNKILISYMNFLDWVKNTLKVLENKEKREKLIQEFIKRPITQTMGSDYKKSVTEGAKSSTIGDRESTAAQSFIFSKKHSERRSNNKMQFTRLVDNISATTSQKPGKQRGLTYDNLSRFKDYERVSQKSGYTTKTKSVLSSHGSNYKSIIRQMKKDQLKNQVEEIQKKL